MMCVMGILMALHERFASVEFTKEIGRLKLVCFISGQGSGGRRSYDKRCTIFGIIFKIWTEDWIVPWRKGN